MKYFQCWLSLNTYRPTEERERREWGSKNSHSEVILTEENDTWRHCLGKRGYRKSSGDEGTSYLESSHVKGVMKVTAFLTNPSKPERSLFKIETSGSAQSEVSRPGIEPFIG